MYDPDKRKLLSAISHGAIFFSTTLVSVGIPIAVLFVSDDPIVKENAKEAINFHLNVWFWALVIGVLVTISFGLLFPLAGLGFLIHWGLTILAIVKVLSHPDESFRYPFIVRLL
ncbi:MAG: hypothetical protein N4J56_000439 [Chroococcidiopsis sp. SAG 2025]|jgi:uncharacterized protein|uniref:DUF4870 domain-containing protein n=1 Tax=Chroococcidiopsis thermalis (strain PCC 7203) TaxID=251229 RepID=K9TVC5_CHRTP|nr:MULTISPECIES: DUF4870 domain-containing protein [Chroococcidiopsis]MBE9019959.1 DUF4870 domain-containing protein [Chroococcidiopsidales cyanobacterium LEGE 13417]PSB46672.1 DUF4870 domain-containing protein [Cyanosarcina cf. burmensis CCALA 770]AFY85959.1 hypothetical protein Chro_0409 [Chroococcidiopsis thermalis PCC 7203]MDV2990785.1 hypothetical protein [Chroococcidiopsis sp. SAG 2025]PSM51100.1 DUF4870 domain-containing protein [Chroococcidiopsis sp. CCALA 051]